MSEPTAPPPELTRNRCEPPAGLLTPCAPLRSLKADTTAADKDAAAIETIGAYARCAAKTFALINWIKARCW